jgi:hypothetical protein
MIENYASHPIFDMSSSLKQCKMGTHFGNLTFHFAFILWGDET